LIRELRTNSWKILMYFLIDERKKCNEKPKNKKGVNKQQRFLCSVSSFFSIEL